MQFEFMNPWAQFGNMSYASLKELGEISTKALEKMGEQQLGLVSTYFDTGIKQVTLLTESKGYKDLMAGQTKLMTEYNEQMLDAMQKTAEIVTDSKDEMAAWFEKTQENGTAPVKKPVLAVKKASA
ncbi:MAG: phasin family protein [Gammaproteobacteria bacterium]